MIYLQLTLISSILFLLLVLLTPLAAYVRNVVTIWATTPIWEQDRDALKKAAEYTDLIAWQLLYVFLFLITLPVAGSIIGQFAHENASAAIMLFIIVFLSHATILYGLYGNVRDYIQQQNDYIQTARAVMAQGVLAGWNISQRVAIREQQLAEQKPTSTIMPNTEPQSTITRIPLGFAPNATPYCPPFTRSSK